MTDRAPGESGGTLEEPQLAPSISANATPVTTVLHIAVPIVLGNLSHMMVSFADTLMVGHLGERPLAALGSAGVVFLVVFLFFSSIYQGVQVLCARRLGEGKPKEAGRILASGITLALLYGVISTILGIVLPPLIMPLFSASPETAHMAADYLQARWGGGMWLVVLVFVFKGFFWGIGITRVDLLVSVLLNVANVFLNWLLIYGNWGCPAMGVAGAGAASAIANGVALAIYVALARRDEFRRDYGVFVDRRVDRQLVMRVARLSLPRALQALAFLHSAAFFAIIGHSSEDKGLAASTVIWRWCGFSVLVAIGIGSAASTLVSQSLGAKAPERAARLGWAAVKVGLVTSGVLIVALFIWERAILRAFLPDSVAVAFAIPAFRVMLLSQLVDSIGIILSRALVGAGAVTYVMLAEWGVAWLICIPSTLLAVNLFNDRLMGAWTGWFVYATAWMIAMLLPWRRGAWKAIEL